jgi:oligopeptide transport system ATP-binding protein
MTAESTDVAGVPVVEVRDLCKTYHHGGFLGSTDVTAVDRVSFALPAGRTLAIVGESGSGKTTVARMIMGLETPSSGAIAFFGVPHPSRMRARDRRRHARVIQMVFQNPYRSLDPRQRVGDAVDELLCAHTELDRAGRRRRTEELFDLVRLSPALLGSLPAELSGGQRQRVCIARALASSPRAIILDESISALDVLVQAQVLNLLQDVQHETGVSYLFVTHDLSVVRQSADDVLVMQSGRAVEQGPVDKVLDAPQHPYTQRLMASVPRPGWRPGAVSAD